MESPCAKYIATVENLRETIDKYGVAIIPKVIDEDECNKMLAGVCEYLEHITQNWELPFERNNTETWREFYKLLPLHSMLLQHWGVGQSQCCWDIRQNPKVVDVFAKFWNVKHEDLLVSFDGLSFHLPPEQTGKGLGRSKWFHTDQSYTRNEFECLQSWITALDVNEGDATLVVLEGSNKYHKDFAEHFNITEKDDWYKLPDNELEFYTEIKKCPEVRIVCGKGDLVLWDSRTIHMGSESSKTRKKENYRCVIYLCYMKREGTSEANLKKKRKAFEEKRTTKHEPRRTLLFPKNPRTYGNPLPEITEIETPVLTELGKRLAGF